MMDATSQLRDILRSQKMIKVRLLDVHSVELIGSTTDAGPIDPLLRCVERVSASCRRRQVEQGGGPARARIRTEPYVGARAG